MTCHTVTSLFERERLLYFELWILLLFVQVGYLLDMKHQILHAYICFRACLEVADSVLLSDLISILPSDLPLIVLICQVNLVADYYYRDWGILVLVDARNPVSYVEERFMIR